MLADTIEWLWICLVTHHILSDSKYRDWTMHQCCPNQMLVETIEMLWICLVQHHLLQNNKYQDWTLHQSYPNRLLVGTLWQPSLCFEAICVRAKSKHLKGGQQESHQGQTLAWEVQWSALELIRVTVQPQNTASHMVLLGFWSSPTNHWLRSIFPIESNKKRFQVLVLSPYSQFHHIHLVHRTQPSSAVQQLNRVDQQKNIQWRKHMKWKVQVQLHSCHQHHHQHTVIQDKKHSESMHHKRIVEMTMTKSETLEKEHTRKKGTSQSLKNTKAHKTISPKLPILLFTHTTFNRTGYDTRDCPSRTRDRCMGWHWQLLMKHPMTLTSTPSTNQNPPSFSFNPHSTRPGLRPYRDSPHIYIRRLCGWHAVSWHSDRSPHNWL